MKKALTFGAGILVGAVLFGGSLAIAAGVTANPTQSRVFVNGNEVKLEAYNIGGNNFFKLRDIGNEVDFSVVWDGEGQRILIDTSRGYDANETYKPQTTETPTTPAPNASLSVKDRIEYVKHNDIIGLITTGGAVPGKLANGKDITAENIAAVFAEIEAIFPDGTSWGDGTNGTMYTHGGDITSGGGCNSWASMVGELLWGKGAQYTTHGDLTKVKAGDIVHLKNDATGREHWFVVTGTGDQLGLPIILSCDGNVGGKVSWGNYAIGAAIYDNPNSTIYSFY
jgi:hypothetical protein